MAAENDGEETKEQRASRSEVGYWIREISAAKKRDKRFLKEGKRVLEIYDGGSGDEAKKQPFSLLYSNTETLLPALYSAIPRPVVQRRFKDEDPIGKSAATAGQRVLEFMLDTNMEEYESFDEAMRSAVMAALLPGRGVAAVKYTHETVDVPGEEGAEATPVKNWELVCLDGKPWDRFLHGYSKKWSTVPWIAYEMHLDKEEAAKAGIPENIRAAIQFTKGEESDESDDQTQKTDSEEMTGETETALFYQIWDKRGGRKVKYFCPQYKEALCAVVDDPLGLTGFFNTPRPIQLVERVDDLTPVPLYSLYEDQAQEVNTLTVRIKHLIKAIKATGAYDTELGDDIKKIVESEEGELIPSDKSSSLAAEKGLQNAIWMWPVEKLIVVLKELYVAREQAKMVVYEITGISDIIRGSTKASETATAQEIKSQWGTLRLKRPQKEVQRYARDLLRMMLDVAAQKFGVRTWAQMTGLPFVTQEAKQQALLIQQAAMMQQQQPDPQIMQTLQSPVWEEVLQTLREDYQRAYRIDIETNSTVEPEAAEDQKQIAELMNALAQYLNGVSPLVQSGAMPFEAAQAMMLAITRRFRFGNEIEDYIKQMQPPKPPDDGKAKQAEMDAQAEAKKLEQQGMVEMAAHQREQQKMADAKELEQMKLQSAQSVAQINADAESQREAMRIEAERRAKQAELQAERTNAEMKARIEQETELKKAAMAGAVQIEVAQISASVQAQKVQQDGEQKAGEQANAKAATAANDSAIKAILKTQEKLLEMIANPKPRELIVKKQGEGSYKGTSKALQ